MSGVSLGLGSSISISIGLSLAITGSNRVSGVTSNCRCGMRDSNRGGGDTSGDNLSGNKSGDTEIGVVTIFGMGPGMGMKLVILSWV